MDKEKKKTESEKQVFKGCYRVGDTLYVRPDPNWRPVGEKMFPFGYHMVPIEEMDFITGDIPTRRKIIMRILKHPEVMEYKTEFELDVANYLESSRRIIGRKLAACFEDEDMFLINMTRNDDEFQLVAIESRSKIDKKALTEKLRKKKEYIENTSNPPIEIKEIGVFNRGLSDGEYIKLEEYRIFDLMFSPLIVI